MRLKPAQIRSSVVVDMDMDLDVDLEGDGNRDLAARSTTLCRLGPLGVPSSLDGQVAVAIAVKVHVHVHDYDHAGLGRAKV